MNDWSASSMNKKQVLCIYCNNLAHQSKHGINIFKQRSISITFSLEIGECSCYVMHISKCGISSAFQIRYQISDMFSGFPRNCTRMARPIQFPLDTVLARHAPVPYQDDASDWPTARPGADLISWDFTHKQSIASWLVEISRHNKLDTIQIWYLSRFSELPFSYISRWSYDF